MNKEEFDQALGGAQDRFQAYQEGLQRGYELGKAQSAGGGCLLTVLGLVALLCALWVV